MKRLLLVLALGALACMPAAGPVVGRSIVVDMLMDFYVTPEGETAVVGMDLEQNRLVMVFLGNGREQRVMQQLQERGSPDLVVTRGCGRYVHVGMNWVAQGLIYHYRWELPEGARVACGLPPTRVYFPLAMVAPSSCPSPGGGE